MDLKNYILNFLIPAKRFDISVPGVIANKAPQKYGNSDALLRTVFFFEDNFVALQKAVTEEVGEDKASKIFYCVGRDAGLRYLTLARAKRFSPFLTLMLLNYLMRGFKAGGTSMVGKVDYDLKKKVIYISGENNIICRKTGNPAFFAGGFDGFLSFLLGEEMRSQINCENCPSCKLVISPGKKKDYVPSEFAKMICKKERFNFPKSKVFSKRNCSLGDFVKFKKIYIDTEGKFSIFGKVVMPTEIGVWGFITYYLKQNGLENVLRDSLIKSSGAIASDVLSKEDSLASKIRFFENIFSAAGWGIPILSREGECIRVDIVNPPYTPLGSDHLIYLINGFLNEIYGKKLEYKTSELKQNPFVLSIKYI